MGCPVLAGIFGVCSRVEVARFLICVFVECVCVSVDGLVCEVEDGRRVDWCAHEAGLKVEMGAEAASGVPAEGDWVADFNILVWFDKEFG